MSNENKQIWAGLELGGTKCLCVIGSGPDNLIRELTIPTTSPSETLDAIIMFLKNMQVDYVINSLGIASFGPLDLDMYSDDYGSILNTPKSRWQQTNLLKTLRVNLDIPVFIDTDVNGAALAEHCWGAAKGLRDFIYLTIGTGIGGGIMVNNQLVHGISHPELGHIRIHHDQKKDPYSGCCPYHGDCLEGLASGVAIEKRWHGSPSILAENHPAWELEVDYLSQALMNYILTLSPQRIIMGGGIMLQNHLFHRLRKRVQHQLNYYLDYDQINSNIDKYIVPPLLGQKAGVCGALLLAQRQ